MTSRRIIFLLIGLPVLALGAGVATGMLSSRLPTLPVSDSVVQPDERSPLAEQLNLSPTQRDQMREIWETVQGRVHRSYEQAQSLQKQRDDALVAILNDEQKAQFEKISKEYADRYDGLVQARDREFHDAVERTKKLLNEDQQLKYDEILKTHVGPAAANKAVGDMN